MEATGLLAASNTVEETKPNAFVVVIGLLAASKPVVVRLPSGSIVAIGREGIVRYSTRYIPYGSVAAGHPARCIISQLFDFRADRRSIPARLATSNTFVLENPSGSVEVTGRLAASYPRDERFPSGID